MVTGLPSLARRSFKGLPILASEINGQSRYPSGIVEIGSIDTTPETSASAAMAAPAMTRIIVSSARQVEVQVFRLAGDLTDDVRPKPFGRHDRRVGVGELDLGEDELAVGELVDLPDVRFVGHGVAALVDATAFGERPHGVEDLLGGLVLELRARDAGAGLDRAKPAFRPVDAHAAQALGQALAGQIALHDLVVRPGEHVL